MAAFRTQATAVAMVAAAVSLVVAVGSYRHHSAHDLLERKVVRSQVIVLPKETAALREVVFSVVEAAMHLPPGQTLHEKVRSGYDDWYGDPTREVHRIVVSAEMRMEIALFEVAEGLRQDVVSIRSDLDEFRMRVGSDEAQGDLDAALAAYLGEDFVTAERSAIVAAKGAAKFVSNDGSGKRTSHLNVMADDEWREVAKRERRAWLLAGDAQFIAHHPDAALKSYGAAARLVPRTEIAAWLAIQRRIAQVHEDDTAPIEALDCRQEIARLCELKFGKDDWRTVEASAWVAWELQREGRTKEAGALVERLLAKARQQFGFPSSPYVQTAMVYEQVQWTAGVEWRARDVMVELLEARRQAPGRTNPELLVLEREMTELFRKRGDRDRARETAGSALRLSERLFGPTHSLVLVDLAALIQRAQDDDKWDEAEALTRRRVEILSKRFGAESEIVESEWIKLDESLAGVRTEPAGIADRARKRLAAAEGRYGPEHPEVAKHLVRLAEVLQLHVDRGEGNPGWDEMLTLARRATALCDSLLGDEPKEVPLATRLALFAVQERALSILANRVDEEVERAEHLYDRMGQAHADYLAAKVQEVEEQRGPRDPEVADALLNLVRHGSAWQQRKDLTPHLRRIVQIYEETLEPDDNQYHQAVRALSFYLRQAGHKAEAEAVMRRLIEKLDAARDPSALTPNLASLAEDLLADGRPHEAAPLLKRAISLSPQESDLTYRWSLFGLEGMLAEALDQDHRLTEAIVVLRDASSRLAALPETSAEARWDVSSHLARLLLKTGQTSEAASLVAQAWQGYAARVQPVRENDAQNYIALQGRLLLQQGHLLESWYMLSTMVAQDKADPHRTVSPEYLSVLAASEEALAAAARKAVPPSSPKVKLASKRAK